MTKIERILIMLERIYLHFGVCISINLTLNFMCGCFKHSFICKGWKHSWGGKCALALLCAEICSVPSVCSHPEDVHHSSRAVSAYPNCGTASHSRGHPWKLSLGSPHCVRDSKHHRAPSFWKKKICLTYFFKQADNVRYHYVIFEQSMLVRFSFLHLLHPLLPLFFLTASRPQILLLFHVPCVLCPRPILPHHQGYNFCIQ